MAENDEHVIQNALWHIQSGQYVIGLSQLLLNFDAAKNAMIEILPALVSNEMQSALNTPGFLQEASDMSQSENWDGLLTLCRVSCPLLTVCIQGALETSEGEMHLSDAQHIPDIVKPILGVLMTVVLYSLHSGNDHSALNDILAVFKRLPQVMEKFLLRTDQQTELVKPEILDQTVISNDTMKSVLLAQTVSSPNLSQESETVTYLYDDVSELWTEEPANLLDNHAEEDDITYSNEGCPRKTKTPLYADHSSISESLICSTENIDSSSYVTVNYKGDVGNPFKTKSNTRKIDSRKNRNHPKEDSPVLAEAARGLVHDIENFVREEKQRKKCDQCNKVFSTVRCLEAHMARHRDDFPIKCECGKGFFFKNEFDKHRLSLKHREQALICNSCIESYPTSDKMSVHMREQHSKKEFFTCKDCRKCFLAEDDLKKHDEVHQKEKPFCCDVCDARYKTAQQLKYHSYSHSQDHPYRCLTCDKGFVYKSLLNNHKKYNHTQERSFKCPKCPKHLKTYKYLQDHYYQMHVKDSKLETQDAENVSSSEKITDNPKENAKLIAELERHSKKHQEEKPLFVCLICDKQLSTAKTLKFHLRRMHEDSPVFKCEKCNKTFNHEARLRRHRAIHEGVTPHSCRECGAQFKYHNQLKNHWYEVHTGIYPYNCDTCKKGFLSEQAVEKHIRSAHTKRRPYTCPLCPKTFFSYIGLRSHYSTHVSETASGDDLIKSLEKVITSESSLDAAKELLVSRNKLNSDVDQAEEKKSVDILDSFLKVQRQKHKGDHIKCDYCEERFGLRRDMIAHRDQHFTGNPKQCPICNKIFAHRSNMKIHQSVHAGEKHICPHCGKEYTSNGTLRTHIRNVHPTGKPVKCPHPGCGKEFAARRYLSNHRRCHFTEEQKKHSCPQCDMSFHEPVTLRRHMLTHSGKKSHNCHVCSKAFSRMDNMKIHVKACHGEGYKRVKKSASKSVDS